jgi:NitT/TauT family transport system permease protein
LPPHRDERGRLIAALLALAILVVWEIVVRTRLVPATFFPPPSAIGVALFEATVRGEMLVHLGATLTRVLSGLALGGLAGTLAGLAMGVSPRARSIADPFVAAFHPVPKLALLPLFMVLLGLGESSRVVVVSLAAFFPMLLNTMAGVRQILRVHFDVARTYGASRWQILARVVVPGSVPAILIGLRLATNIAFVSAIAVEMVASGRGLGSQVWLSWQVLRVELLYATLFVIALLGVTINTTLRWLARRGAPWLSEREITV